MKFRPARSAAVSVPRAGGQPLPPASHTIDVEINAGPIESIAKAQNEIAQRDADFVGRVLL
jgi:hypothetical protein